MTTVDQLEFLFSIATARFQVARLIGIIPTIECVNQSFPFDFEATEYTYQSYTESYPSTGGMLGVLWKVLSRHGLIRGEARLRNAEDVPMPFSQGFECTFFF